MGDYSDYNTCCAHRVLVAKSKCQVLFICRVCWEARTISLDFMSPHYISKIFNHLGTMDLFTKKIHLLLARGCDTREIAQHVLDPLFIYKLVRKSWVVTLNLHPIFGSIVSTENLYSFFFIWNVMGNWRRWIIWTLFCCDFICRTNISYKVMAVLTPGP